MEKLVAAIEAGDSDGVKHIVRDENLIHRINAVTDSRRMTPLHHACSGGHLNMVTWLVTTGRVDVNYKDSRGDTPLHKACEKNHFEVVQWLIKNTKLNDDTAVYVLRWACGGGHFDIITLLVTTGCVDVNYKDEDGETLLHKACWNGHIHLSRHLIEKCNASVHAITDGGYTPLHLACRMGRLDIVKYMVTKTNSDVTLKDKRGRTPLDLARRKDHLEVVQWLIKNTKLNDDTAVYVLRWACGNGHLDIVTFLVTTGRVDVNCKDRSGRTPLHEACENGHIDVSRYLIEEYNASVHATNNRGFTPLHLACGWGRLDVVQYMVTKTNSDVNTKTKTGETPLDVARRRRKHKVVSFLEEHLDIKSDSLEPRSETNVHPPLTDNEMRILKIILTEHLDQLNENGVSLDLALSRGLLLSKQSVVEGLHLIGQVSMAKILGNKQGVKDLQDYIFTNVYQESLRNEQHQISLQIFRMILCGVPRTGKTTFWKRLAKVKGFQPSENSPSTAAYESHTIAATSPHLDAAMLFDLYLYEDTTDLKKEALTIYKHILMTHNAIALIEDPPQRKAISDSHPMETDSNTSILDTTISPVSLQDSEKAKFVPDSEEAQSPASLPSDAIVKQRDPIMEEINKYFEDLTLLLRSGEDLPDVPLIKKLCSLADVGGQRAFLEMLPTVTIGKALYLLFFSYENFEKQLSETVQLKASPQEVRTGTRYKQMEVIMQSLICVSTTSKISSENVALLVGTHIDKVETQDINRVNAIIHENVKPFLKETLVYAQENQLALEVSIKPNKRCSNNPKEYQNNNPEDYQKVIMNLVENRLKCSESEKLPASWYIFSIILRRMQLAGHSILQFHHCEHIAGKLYIKQMQLQALLSRMHKILGIVIYFPEVEQLKDIVICDPAVVYKSISELIFNSFSETSHPKLSLRLKKWGVFMVKELKERCKEKEGCPLQLDKLLLILEHLGIIAPVNIIKTAESSVSLVDPVDPDNAECDIHPQYVIPCILNDAQEAQLSVQIQEAQVCSIIPLRINFACGFAPMGGFCYLFTRLITNNRDKGWELLLPDIFDETTKNDIYWRNKVTFRIDERYYVTLLSTHEYYEIHIIYSQPTRTFQLSREGHQICKKVWDAVSSILSKSLSESLHNYMTACECIIHQNNEHYDGHVMAFSHNPDDCPPHLTASCLKDKAKPISVKVDETKQSIIVWFKEPRVCQSTDIGKAVELSVDLIFKVKHSDEKPQYKWSVDDEEIEEDDGRYQLKESGVLAIQEFENEAKGLYQCIISTTVLSVSTEVQLQLTAPPEIFDPKMRPNKFLLFLNANGISYEVCKMLKGCKITAGDFNLRSYELWSQNVQLSWKDEPVLKNLIALCHCPPHTGLSVTHGLPTSAEISWKPLPEGEQRTIITGYTVQVVGASSTREISVSDARATSITVSKLQPSTSYTFNVSAVTNTGNGPIAIITSTTPEEELITSSPSTIPSAQCPICKSILIDPCTLQCGHTTCQLCLAKMWVHKDTICPLCKEPWQVLPAVAIDLRDNIESAHSDEVALLRSQYSDEDKEIIQKCLQAKITLRQEETVQHQMIQEEIDQDSSSELQITEQPQSNTSIMYGQAVTLSVSATSCGAENLIYLWKKDGQNLYNNIYINGTNKPILTIREFLPDSQGSYTCLIKNYNSSIESEQADMSLDFQVLEHPESMHCGYHAPVSLSVSAIGPGALTYQWKRGGAIIDDEDCTGVDEATLTIKSFSLKHEGHYLCEVECNGNYIESEPAKLECSKSQNEDIDNEKSMSAQTTDFAAVWKLLGVEECDETCVIVHSSRGQFVEWNGLKLYIYAGSLPEGLQQCTIFIKASLAGDYEIPETTSLVSAIYWLRCEPQCIFIKPIMVEIQHCSTKQDLSKLKIVRALCSQKPLPYKFKPLEGGRFDADTSYGAIKVARFSGLGIIEERSVSKRLYFNQLFYCNNEVHQHRRDIHIIYTWNTEAHINYINKKYPEQCAGCYQVVELDEDVIKVGLEGTKWTEVMDRQWEIYPIKPVVTKAELDDFKIGLRIPNCVLEAHPLVQPIPRLLHEITMNGVKPPYNKLTLRLAVMPARKDHPSGASMQQPQSPPTVQMPVDVNSQQLTFSNDMSNEQLAQWLRNHPCLSGVDYEEDISKLIGAKVSAHVFLDLNESVLTQITSLGFQLAIMRIIKDMKNSQQPPSSERVPLQQQSPTSSVTTPRTTQHQLSSTTGRQAKIGERSSKDQEISTGGPVLSPPRTLESIDATPTLKNLSMLKTAEGKRVKIISTVAPKWRVLGDQLDFDEFGSKLDAIETKNSNDPEKCCREIFQHWLKGNGVRPCSWRKLIELLEDCDFEVLAGQVNSVFSAK